MIPLRHAVLALALVVAGLGVCGGAEHDHATPAGPPPPQLGSVNFSVSCREDLRDDFDRALALVHSFWHDEAEREFRRIAQQDPGCAMAWWGVAFTHAHPILATPTGADITAGNDALMRADAASTQSPRETAYIHALEVLYAGFDASPAESQAAQERYADAMASIVKAWPADVDAKAFLGLALIDAAPSDDDTLAWQKRAVAVLAPAFQAHPDHPGLAHYLIHATDNPPLAKEGLVAARRYAALAPAAPHALHMPSHIFARLGLWAEDVESNLAARRTAERELAAHRAGAESLLHALEFLEYAYLQRGDVEAAEAAVDAGRQIPASEVDERYANYHATAQARFTALLAMETQDWDRAAHLRPAADTPWSSQQVTFLAQAMAAGFQRDANAGARAEREMEALLARLPKRPGDDRLSIVQEIHAWAAFARGELEQATALLRPIADRQAVVGKGEVELPAREMIAQMFMLDGKPALALKEFTASLASDPNRFQSLVGAGRAADALGRRGDAARYYRAVLDNCPHPNGAAALALGPAKTFLATAGVTPR